MKTALIVGLAGLTVALVLCVSVAWKVYAYNECRHVGHGTFYCVFHG